MSERSPRDGVDGFIADLADFNIAAFIDGPVVRYSVTPIDGSMSGSAVETAVGIVELAPWPAAPPHWIHLPAHFTFAHTNTQPQGSLLGWLCHSRNITSWTPSAHPGRQWLAHVRTVLGQITGTAA